jgi:hypothetical protein
VVARRLYNATLVQYESRVQFATVHFMPAHDKESRVQNTEIEDRVSSLCVINCKVNNCSSAKEGPNKPSVKNKHSTNYCHVPRGTHDNINFINSAVDVKNVY